MTAAAGLPYGAAVAVAVVMDEALVPAVGLSGPPWASPASTHVYALASQLVFGLTVEVVRRGVHDLLGPDGPPRGKRARRWPAMGPR